MNIVVLDKYDRKKYDNNKNIIVNQILICRFLDKDF